MADPEESDALQAARRQRRGVRAALVAIESALASPAVDDRWYDAVGQRLDELRAAFAHHVEVTEHDDGLLVETLERAPRLARRVQLIRDDHVAITGSIEAAVAALTACRDSRGDEEIGALRASVTDVMGRVTRHRQLGADLVYDAYNVDIEGGE